MPSEDPHLHYPLNRQRATAFFQPASFFARTPLSMSGVYTLFSTKPSTLVKNPVFKPPAKTGPSRETSSSRDAVTVQFMMSLWNCMRYLFLVAPPSV